MRHTDTYIVNQNMQQFRKKSHHRAAYHTNTRTIPIGIEPEQLEPGDDFLHHSGRVRVVIALQVAPRAGAWRCPLARRWRPASSSVFEGFAVAEVFAFGTGLLDRHPRVLAGTGLEVVCRAHDDGKSVLGRRLE